MREDAQQTPPQTSASDYRVASFANWGRFAAKSRPKGSKRPGQLYEFGQQLDAMMFWDRFKGRWLQGEEFSFPERPDNMPTLKEPKRRESFDRKPPDLRR